MDCLDPNVAAAFLADDLDAEARGAVEGHIDVCASCRQVLADLSRLEPAPDATDRGESAPPTARGSRSPRRRRIAGFELHDRLGEGGMGVVHRARDTATEDWVALKWVVADDCTEQTRRRFQRECAAVRALDHPNVVRVRGSGETDDGLMYLAMELLDGQDLATRLEGAPLDARTAAEIGIAVAAGLEAAHARGLVHRDVKPGNVFLCSDGRIKLLDFGLAVPFGSARGVRFTGPAAVIGTPAFMAPEQARGGRDEDARTDVWGLGATLYAAVCGRPPYEGESPLDLLVRITTEPPDPMPAHVPAWLAAVIGRALERDRAERFGLAREMAAALAQGLGGLAAEPEAGPALWLGDEVRVLSVLRACDLTDADAVERAIEREGGLTLLPSADEVVGVFGGSVWSGDEPERAVRAGLQARGANPGAEIGVTTARSTIDAEGAIAASMLRAVRAASAVEGVGVDAATLRRIRGGFQLGDGVVLAERPGHDVVGVRGLGAADTPLHGRDAERAALAEVLRSAFDDRRAGGTLLVGPMGIGKSRLVHAVEADAVERWPELFRLSCRGEAGAAAEPWHALARGLRGHLAADVGVADAAETLARLLDGAAVAVAKSSEESQAWNDRVMLSLGERLEAVLSRGPMLVVLEDCELIDRASLRAVWVLLRRFADRPLCVVATAQAPASVPLPCLALGPLSFEATRAIVAAAGATDQQAAAIHARCEGNPLYAEELALAARWGRAQLPLPLEAALQARLDELPRADRNLLRRASVFGTRFSTEGLLALGQAEAAPLLSALRRRDLIVADSGLRGATEDTWRFRHVLFQEIAYRSLTSEQQVELHRSAGRWLASRADAPATEVATQLLRGGLPEEAAPHALRAAEGAHLQADNALALEWAERARGYLRDPGAAVRLAALVVDARVAGGEPVERVESDLAELERLAETREERTSACQRRVLWLRASGRVQEAAAAARRGLEVAPDDVGLLSERALALIDGGDPAGAFASARRALAQAERAGEPLAVARAASALAMCEFRRGELGAALVLFERALGASDRAGHARRIAGSLGRVGACLVALGASAAATERLERVLALSRALGLRIAEAYALQNLGLAVSRQGRVEEGLAAEERALAIAREIAMPQLFLETLRNLALILWEAGRAADALSAFDRVPPQWSSQAIMDSPETLALRALLHASAGDLARARPLAERALELRRAAEGMGELEAELFLAAGACGVPGALEEGRRVLEARASRITDPRQREAFRVGIPANARLLGATAGGPT